MGGQILGDEGQRRAGGGRWELEGSRDVRDVSSLPCTVGPVPRLPKIHQSLFAPPLTPFSLWPSFHQPSPGGSSWKTDWNSKVLTELYGFWHFAFSKARIFFMTDLYAFLVSSSSISNGQRKGSTPEYNLCFPAPASFPPQITGNDFFPQNSRVRNVGL